MANLDSRSKRASSVNIAKSYAAAMVLPDGTITSDADRQHAAWSYSGIDAQTIGGGGMTVGGVFSSGVFGGRIIRVMGR